MREKILAEIRRLAAANGGQPPGWKKFEKITEITPGKWRGIFWAKWSDALRDAGFAPNDSNAKLSTEILLEKLANSCRYYGKIPTFSELRLYGRQQDSFPSHNTFHRAFPSKTEMTIQLKTWAEKNDSAKDILDILSDTQIPRIIPTTSSNSDSFVYLIKSGDFYKIGRSNEIERRMKEIRTALPDAAEMIHVIKTDDSAGIEAYWHRRFQSCRANGEWFKLSPSDVAAFKRRRYQ